MRLLVIIFFSLNYSFANIVIFFLPQTSKYFTSTSFDCAWLDYACMNTKMFLKYILMNLFCLWNWTNLYFISTALKIHISNNTKALLEKRGNYNMEYRGEIEVKVSITLREKRNRGQGKDYLKEMEKLKSR